MQHTGTIRIGSRWELLVDGVLIDRLSGVRFDLKHPERREAFVLEAPWETGSAFPYAVLADGDVVRLYYRATISGVHKLDRVTLAALAESHDGGRTFCRPELGLTEFRGSRANNLLPTDTPGVPPPFIDTNPDCRAAERYKGLQSHAGQLYALASSDGITWRRMTDRPLEYPGAFDTVNTAFWDSIQECYRSYTRVWVNRETAAGMSRVRCIQSALSEDFVHWTAPVENVYADGEPDVQLYTNATLPCPGAEHLYLSFPNRYVQQRWIRHGDTPAPSTPGCNDGLFMASRDGVHWTRYLDAWVRPGLDPQNWGQRCNYPVWGIVPTSDTEWSLYITEHYMLPDAPGRIRRLAVRPRGFVSLHAEYCGGEFVTKPLVFEGRCLRLNYATSAAGSIRVEIQDADGRALEGFGLEDMNPLFGDDLDAGVTWKGGGDLEALRGRPVRLRFVMHDADLFALRFSATKRDVTSGEIVLPPSPTYRIQASCSEIRVPRVNKIPFLEGDPGDWDRTQAVTVRTPDQFGDFCYAKITLLYDDEALYVGGEVADPYPLRNPLAFDGDMRKSWESDALQLHLQAVTDDAPGEGAETGINDIRLWYSTPERAAGCCILPGSDPAKARVNPEGAQGSYRERPDGKGYTFTWRLPWTVLNATRAPRAGERLTACIQCHWGTEDGRDLLCGGVEVRSDNAPEVYVRASWGQAVFA